MRQKFITTAELSEETTIPVGTLKYWRQIGEGPNWTKLGRRRVGYERVEVDAWLAAQRRSVA